MLSAIFESFSGGFDTRDLATAARLLDEPQARRAALRMAHGLRGLLRSDGWLSGAFDDGWMPAASHACIAGLTQLAAAWLRVAQTSGDAGWPCSSGLTGSYRPPCRGFISSSGWWTRWRW